MTRQRQETFDIARLITEIRRSSGVFASVKAADLEKLLEHREVRSYPTRTLLVERRKETPEMYFVGAGRLSVVPIHGIVRTIDAPTETNLGCALGAAATADVSIEPTGGERAWVVPVPREDWSRFLSTHEAVTRACWKRQVGYLHTNEEIIAMREAEGTWRVLWALSLAVHYQQPFEAGQVLPWGSDYVAKIAGIDQSAAAKQLRLLGDPDAFFSRELFRGRKMPARATFARAGLKWDPGLELVSRPSRSTLRFNVSSAQLQAFAARLREEYEAHKLAVLKRRRAQRR